MSFRTCTLGPDAMMTQATMKYLAMTSRGAAESPCRQRAVDDSAVSSDSHIDASSVVIGTVHSEPARAIDIKAPRRPPARTARPSVPRLQLVDIPALTETVRGMGLPEGILSRVLAAVLDNVVPFDVADNTSCTSTRCPEILDGSESDLDDVPIWGSASRSSMDLVRSAKKEDPEVARWLSGMFGIN
eukprot:jgi/Mesvir1/20711/Mv14907-RA.1